MRNHECIKCNNKFDVTMNYAEDHPLLYYVCSQECFDYFIQPERSKREEFDFCYWKKLLDDNIWYNSQTNYQPNINPDIILKLYQELNMRCSEHCGNTVRDK